MEIKKTSVPSSAQPEIQPKSEVSKTKSSAQSLISDSFETSKSSDSNQGSTASSEPEKKAGQITGGILIKQMTAARIGETSVGKKELTPEQQSRVSNSDLRKQNLNPSFFLQDARSKDEDRKNSGFQNPFAPPKSADSEQQSKVNQSRELGKNFIGKSTTVQDGSQKDFSNDPLLNGTKLNDAVQNAVDTRKKDVDGVAGQSGSDRLNDLLNPTAKGPQQSSRVGKDQLAYEKTTRENHLGGGYTEFYDSADKDEDGVHVTHNESTYDTRNHLVESYKTETDYLNNKSVVVTETHTFVEYNKEGNETKDTTTTTTTTTNADGRTHVETSTTIANEGGTTTTTTTVTDTPDGGGAKSYDQENYTGNIPDEVKKSLDYFRQQVAAQKPSSGGETVHTDDSASGGTITGGPISNLFVQQGSLGLFGNPGSPDLQTGQSGGRGPVGSSQSGGNVDYGPDSDKVGYNGPTHQDDPGDVQFGPQTPVAEGSVEPKNVDDSSSDSNDFTDILNRKRRRAE